MNMRINPNAQSQFYPPSESKALGSTKTAFQNVLASKQADTLKELQSDLKQVSQDLKTGKISDEQASRQFVNLVISKRSELGLSQQNLAKVESAIGDLVSQDPNFMANLRKAL
jgi:hypothetical protein